MGPVNAANVNNRKYEIVPIKYEPTASSIRGNLISLLNVIVTQLTSIGPVSFNTRLPCLESTGR